MSKKNARYVSTTVRPFHKVITHCMNKCSSKPKELKTTLTFIHLAPACHSCFCFLWVDLPAWDLASHHWGEETQSQVPQD